MSNYKLAFKFWGLLAMFRGYVTVTSLGFFTLGPLSCD